MAMQQSGKGAGVADTSSSGPKAALSDEQAEEFAASFTPAWDTGENGHDSGPDAPDAPAAAVVAAAAPEPAPAPAPAKAKTFNPKQTLIGTPPPANAPIMAAPAPVAASAPVAAPAPAAPVVVQGPPTDPMRPAASSAEAIEPENILKASTAPPVPRGVGMGGTLMMSAAPAKPPVEARKAPANQPSRPAPGPAARAAPSRPSAAIAVSADPFRSSSQSSRDDEDFVPKKSSKSVVLVVAGLAVAAALGLFLKFALSDDPKPAQNQPATGPAVTAAEIPPPPPKVEVEAPAPTTATSTATAATTGAPLEPLAAPTTAARPTPTVDTTPRPPALAAPRNEPRAGRPAAPQTAAAPVLPPAQTPPASKTPPKAPNGGIVRDNPF